MARITMRNSQKATFAEVFEVYISAVTARGVKDKTSCIYRMVRAAETKGYPLFEKNIREYLGNKGINKRIYQTLKSDK